MGTIPEAAIHDSSVYVDVVGSAIAHESELVRLQKTLYSSSNPTRKWLHCTRRDWIIQRLRRCALERPGRALEVGFGSGVYLPELANLYQEVVAMDLTEAFLNNGRSLAKKFPNLQVVGGDITRCVLPDAQFDLVLCSEVIEHIDRSERAI